MLRVVEGGKPAQTKRQHRLWNGCQVCEVDIGVRSRAVVQIKLAPEVDTKGNLVGGQKSVACAFCMARGKLTTVSA